MKREEVLHITTKHTGKMEGMQSLSTSCKQNPYCKKRSEISGSICEKCYAQVMMKRFKELDPCLTKNGEVLSSRLLKFEEQPTLNVAYFRFEAFGDLLNETHVINYFNICKKNPDTHFALWTKNPHLIARAIDFGHDKPKNLQIILSSPYINIKTINNKWDFVDKTFTVYDRQFIIQNNVKTNCHGKNCLECKLCYQDNGVTDIREQLK